MKIVIPMSGLGSRFVAAGYQDIKPLIKVFNKPIIEWVVSMFSPEDEFIFICRDEHLNSTNLKDELSRIKPSAKIVSIKGHKKGPVYAVTKIADLIKDDEPIIVSYCDYYMHWDYQQFQKDVKKNNCAGAIPCYTGFHPNLLPKENLYASCLIDENDFLKEIREKHSFTKDKAQSLHSPGLYYFSNGASIKKYFQMMLDQDINLNGEYYVSLVYNLMVAAGLSIYVPANVSHFCQWGTPHDLEEFVYWVNLVRGVKK